ncbi:Na+/H+ antiporter, partial [Acetobacter sp. DmW_125124]
PMRDAVVVAATGVIVLSLLAASVFIPLCLRFLPHETVDKNAQEENMARQKLIRAALAVLTKARTQPPAPNPKGTALAKPEGQSAADEALRQEVIDRLYQLYHSRLEEEDETPRITPLDRNRALRHARMDLALRLQLLRAERQAMRDMTSRREINDQTEWKLQQELDYEEQVIRSQSQRLPREA